MKIVADNHGPNFVVIGAGVTGLTVAYDLSHGFNDRVTLVEQEPHVGGLAATVTKRLGEREITVDLGSHRIHPDFDSAAVSLIRDLCGDDLLARERKGMIFVGQKQLRYPPSALDIMLGFGVKKAARFTGDYFVATIVTRALAGDHQSFESYAIGRVGRSLYEEFYRPYAEKLWGLPPEQISSDPAANRLRKLSLLSLLRDIGSVCRSPKNHVYFYPAKGIGQIADTMRDRFLANGGKLLLGSRLVGVSLANNRRVSSVTVRSEARSQQTLECDVLISTIPIDVFRGYREPTADLDSHSESMIQWRGLRILFLLLNKEPRYQNETFYFPGKEVQMGRVSQVNRYSPALNRNGATHVMTIEIPYSTGDNISEMTDAELTRSCMMELIRAEIIAPDTVASSASSSVRLPHAYPLYEIEWHQNFKVMYDQLNAIENLFMIGRSALFLHCNIDHCIIMGKRLAEFLASGARNKEEWELIAQRFRHVRVRE